MNKLINSYILTRNRTSVVQLSAEFTSASHWRDADTGRKSVKTHV